jgi:hypothetical protein
MARSCFKPHASFRSKDHWVPQLSPANADLRLPASCKESSTDIKDTVMATDLETNKATVREFFGAVERRDFKVFDQIVVENYAHNIQDMPIGRESLKRCQPSRRAVARINPKR